MKLIAAASGPLFFGEPKMTEDLKPIDMELNCAAVTLRGQPCRKRPVFSYNGRELCGIHYIKAMDANELEEVRRGGEGEL